MVPLRTPSFFAASGGTVLHYGETALSPECTEGGVSADERLSRGDRDRADARR
jgi:hypothetical protein